jgi:uncharacterized protein with ParB-like and HNH nuclease domain
MFGFYILLVENDFITLEVIMEPDEDMRFSGKSGIGRMKVGELIDLEKKGKLVVQPKYQRDFFWSKETQEDFIRNVFYAGYPFVLTFYVMPTGVREVIDGHQRITTLLNYAKACPDEVLEKIRKFRLVCVEFPDVSYEERKMLFLNANR